MAVSVDKSSSFHLYSDVRVSRYNLKRRVASLPPISAEIFADKVLTAQASSTAVAAKASFEKICPACQKTYYSENAYENHMKSQRHRMRLASQAKDGTSTEDGETTSVMSSTLSLGDPINSRPIPQAISTAPHSISIDAEAEEEFTKVVNGIKETKITEEPVSRRPTRPRHSAGEQRIEHPLSPEKPKIQMAQINSSPAISRSEEKLRNCLFCNAPSATLNNNVEHMIKNHGMFIPERKYLLDLEGLLTWLYERIQDEPHECLYCHKSKSTAEAIQDHMKDSGHCKIAFEEEVDMIEVGQFYDFRSTYSDDSMNEDSDENMRTDESNEDGWEDDSDIESEDGDEEVEGGEDSQPKERRSKPRVRSKDEALILDDELHLPSGKIAGHRSLAKYYRQNLRDHPSAAEIVERQRLLEAAQERGDEDVPMTNSGPDGTSESEAGRGRHLISRANGGLGMVGVTDAKKREVQAVEKRDTKRAQRSEKQYQWAVDKKGNNQKHFRDPLLQ